MCCSQAISPANFPSRPVKKLHERTLLTPKMRSNTDGADLVDYWTLENKAPKNALRKMGYKMVKDEAGNYEIQEREGAQVGGERSSLNLLVCTIYHTSSRRWQCRAQVQFRKQRSHL